MDYENLLDHPEKVKLLAIKDVILLNKNLDINNLTPDLKAIALESFKIESQYKKARSTFNEIKDKLLCDTDPWVNEKEIQDIEQMHFGTDKNIAELQFNALHIDNFIKKIRLNEVRQLIENKAELVVDENFVKNYPMAAKFIRKLMLDNINFTMFGKVDPVNASVLVEKVEHNLKKKMTTFIYFNTHPMEKIKANKISEIVDSNGKIYQVKELYQSNDMFEILSQIEKRLIKLKVRIFYGTIICGEK